MNPHVKTKILYIMKSIRFLIILSLLAFFVSCEKDPDLGFFDKQYPTEAPWPTVTDFEFAVIGNYWMVSGYTGPNYPFMNARLTLDAESDGLYWNANFSGNATTKQLYERDNSSTNSETDNIFNRTYKEIGNACDALDFLATDPYRNDINKAQVPRQEGEIRFCRAWTWWVLSTTHIPMYDPAGANSDTYIPWLEHLPTGFEDAVNQELATTQQIYDIIVSDLVKAITLLPDKFVAGVHPDSYQYGRANKNAARALLVRVYMQMNEWALAEDLCDAIIASGDYNLLQDPIEAFNKAYGFAPVGTEVIWYYLMYEGDGIGSWKIQTTAEQFCRTRRTSEVNPNRSLACSDSFLETVGWQDPVTKEPTAEALADKRYNQLYYRYTAATEPNFTLSRAYVWGNKYYRDRIPNPNAGQRTNIPMLRLPEIYLTRAILRFKNGDVPGATADVNMVRNRAGVAPLATVTEDDIHNERWKELNFEGDRTNYLRALHKSVPNGDRGAGSVAWNSPSWIWPVMEREKELNKAYF